MTDEPAGSGSAFETSRDALLRRIGRGRLTMGITLAVGRLITLITPALIVAALFLSVSWFGLFRLMPDALRIAVLIGFALAFLASLYPLRAFRKPSASEIDARLEGNNAVRHQAITAQEDTLSDAGPVARALWEEHQRRLAGTIPDLRTGRPESDLPRLDPFGVRVAAALLLFIAWGYAQSGGAGRLADAFSSHDTITLADVRIDAWITPPPYVRQAPVFLTGIEREAGAVVDAIEGSTVTIRFGGAGARDTDAGWTPVNGTLEKVPERDSGEKPASEAAATATGSALVREFQPASDGLLTIRSARGDLAFNLRITPDNPPVATFVDEPRRTGATALELVYTLNDDFGLASAEAEIVPATPPATDAVPLYDPPKFRLILPRRGSPDGKAAATQDLSDHPLAGTPVRITLIARDGAGQEGRSETMEMILPGRIFSVPLAGAVAEQRSVLALDANRLPRVFDLIDAATIAPEETIPNLSHYLLVESVRGRLAYAHDTDQLKDAADYMWGVALEIEDGQLSDAARRLRDAQNALAEALENGASDEEIAQLMQELREAMNDYLRELARQMQDNPDAGQQQAMPENMLRQRDLDNMLDQIENLARSGARDQAQALLNELNRMMNNLQAGRQQRGQQQGGPMRQQMDKLGEMMRRQQQLMDETMRAERQQRGGQDGEQQQGQQQPGQQQPGQQQGEGGQSLQELLDQLGQQQQALQQDLEQLKKDLEALGIQPSEGFGEAGEAMGDASGNLGEGETGSALSDQGRALQALREGAGDMMNQMMQAMGQDQGEAEGEGPDRNGRGTAGPDDRDPLGRPRATTGPEFGGRVQVPDEIDIQRTRRILEEIRRRFGNQLAPDIERQYLERLLDLN